MSGVEVNTYMAASPERVWDLIGDPSRMGEWSPECAQVNWTGATQGPGLGARFKGHNRLGWRRWTTTGTIVRYEPEREISWDVDYALFPIARWTYRIDPAPGGEGCTVVESFLDRRSSVPRRLGPLVRGVRDVPGHNRAGMEQTLARLKAAAEAGQSSAGARPSAD